MVVICRKDPALTRRRSHRWECRRYSPRRRCRLLIVSAGSLGSACPLSGRHSAWHPVQNRQGPNYGMSRLRFRISLALRLFPIEKGPALSVMRAPMIVTISNIFSISKLLEQKEPGATQAAPSSLPRTSIGRLYELRHLFPMAPAMQSKVGFRESVPADEIRAAYWRNGTSVRRRSWAALWTSYCLSVSTNVGSQTHAQ